MEFRPKPILINKGLDTRAFKKTSAQWLDYNTNNKKNC